MRVFFTDFHLQLMTHKLGPAWLADVKSAGHREGELTYLSHSTHMDLLRKHTPQPKPITRPTPQPRSKRPPLPSAFQQLKNLLAAAAQAALAIVRKPITGAALARTPAQQAAVLAICAPCEFWDAKASRCLKCGCFAKFKSRLAAWHCPIGKW